MRWLNKEIQFLIRNFSIFPTKYICQKLQRNYGQVSQKANLLKLFKSKKVLSDNSRKYNINHKLFKIITQEKAYVLGLLAADGCVSKNVISLSQSHKRGLQLLKCIKKILKINNKIFFNKKTDSYRFYIVSNEIVKDLHYYNIVPRKSYKLKFPINLQSIFYNSFIRGYVDGDGSAGIYKYDKRLPHLIISFVGTKHFIKKCQYIIPTKANLRFIQNSHLCELRFTGQKAIKFGYWVWKNKNLPKYYKENIWKTFILKYSPRYIKYNRIKHEFIKYLNQNIKIFKIASILKIPQSTLYRWKKLVQKGLLTLDDTKKFV